MTHFHFRSSSDSYRSLENLCWLGAGHGLAVSARTCATEILRIGIPKVASWTLLTMPWRTLSFTMRMLYVRFDFRKHSKTWHWVKVDWMDPFALELFHSKYWTQSAEIFPAKVQLIIPGQKMRSACGTQSRIKRYAHSHVQNPNPLSVYTRLVCLGAWMFFFRWRLILNLGLCEPACCTRPDRFALKSAPGDKRDASPSIACFQNFGFSLILKSLHFLFNSSFAKKFRKTWNTGCVFSFSAR